MKAHRLHEDLLAVILRFDSGVIGLLEVNWLTPTKVRQLTVTGERGTFVVDYLNQHLTLYENAHESESGRRWTSSTASPRATSCVSRSRASSPCERSSSP